jgi:hypothetical protein
MLPNPRTCSCRAHHTRKKDAGPVRVSASTVRARKHPVIRLAVRAVLLPGPELGSQRQVPKCSAFRIPLRPARERFAGFRKSTRPSRRSSPPCISSGHCAGELVALSERPNAEVRQALAHAYGLDKYKELWREEVKSRTGGVGCGGFCGYGKHETPYLHRTEGVQQIHITT